MEGSGTPISIGAIAGGCVGGNPGLSPCASVLRPAGGNPGLSPCASVLRPAGGRELGLLLLSGGTTGAPKLIPRSHCDYLYNARTAAAVTGFDTESVYLVVLPVAFNFTMACPGILGTIAAGGRVVLSTPAIRVRTST